MFRFLTELINLFLCLFYTFKMKIVAQLFSEQPFHHQHVILARCLSLDPWLSTSGQPGVEIDQSQPPTSHSQSAIASIAADIVPAGQPMAQPVVRPTTHTSSLGYPNCKNYLAYIRFAYKYIFKLMLVKMFMYDFDNDVPIADVLHLRGKRFFVCSIYHNNPKLEMIFIMNF